MRALEFIGEDLLYEYRLDNRQKMYVTNTLINIIADNKKNYNLWKKAFSTHDVWHATNFVSSVIDTKFKDAIKDSRFVDVDDVHDLFFAALTGYDLENKNFINNLNKAVEIKYQNNINNSKNTITDRVIKIFQKSA